MIVEDTPLAGVKIIAPRKHGDHRGFFSETYNRRTLAAAGVDLEFVQDNHSLSAQTGTLRGLHFQAPPFAQDKLVRVVRGAVLDVTVDLRTGSATYGRHFAVRSIPRFAPCDPPVACRLNPPTPRFGVAALRLASASLSRLNAAKGQYPRRGVVGDRLGRAS